MLLGAMRAGGPCGLQPTPQGQQWLSSSAAGWGRVAVGAWWQSGREGSRPGLRRCAGDAWDRAVHRLGWAGPGSCNSRGSACPFPRGESFLIGCTGLVARIGLGSQRCARWASVGSWAGWACCGARGSLWQACVGRLLWGAAGRVLLGCRWLVWSGFRLGGRHVAGLGLCAMGECGPLGAGQKWRGRG